MNFDLYAVLLIGFLGGFSHCIGMCGGFVATYSLKLAQDSTPGRSWFRTQLFPHLLYNSGRVLTYTLLGEVFGLLGMTLGSLVAFKSFQGGLMIFAGIVMIFMGLDFAGLFPALPQNTFWGVNKFKSLVHSMLNRVNSGNIFGLGFVMGFLPCGMVYAVAAKAAATQSIWQGGLTMLVFGIGTFPAMVLTGIAASLVSSRLQSTLYKIAAILVIVLGVLTVSKGYQKLIGQAPAHHHQHNMEMKH